MLTGSRHKDTKSQRFTKIVFVKLGVFESLWRRIFFEPNTLIPTTDTLASLTRLIASLRMKVGIAADKKADRDYATLVIG